jgi:hypothetical protein
VAAQPCKAHSFAVFSRMRAVLGHAASPALNDLAGVHTKRRVGCRTGRMGAVVGSWAEVKRKLEASRPASSSFKGVKEARFWREALRERTRSRPNH